MDIPSLSDIKRAHTRISDFILNTQILTCHTIDDLSGAEIYFKCENFQKVGAFKMRGASNVILSCRPEDRVNGFATHSSGNHGQAMALAAKLAGSKAYIAMPHNAPEVKKQAVAGYGAQVVYCESNEQSRESACQEIIDRTGAIFVHPFNDPRIIAGQGTAAKELLEDIPDLDAILVPVGGGGLAAGTALTVTSISPKTKVYLAEPENVDDTFRSFKSGKLTPVVNPQSIADGLLVSVGDLNFEIIQQNVEDVFTVSEKEIVAAMRLVWERMKIIIEPSSAVPVAALLKNKGQFAGKKTGIIITGGNVDLTRLPF